MPGKRIKDGNIAFTSSSDKSKERMREIGKFLKLKLEEGGIVGKIKIAPMKSKTAKKMLRMSLVTDQKNIKNLDVFDTVVNADKVCIWSFPLSLFDEKITKTISDHADYITKPIYRVDKDGNISIIIDLKNGDDSESAIINVFKKEGFNTRKKNNSSGNARPGCIVTLETNLSTSAKKTRTVQPAKRTKTQKPETNSSMEQAVENLALLYLQGEDLPKKRRMAILKAILPEGFGLYKKSSADMIQGGLIVVKPLNFKDVL
mgnify:CR=1 FL=1|jgi:hypothetical protein